MKMCTGKEKNNFTELILLFYMMNSKKLKEKKSVPKINISENCFFITTFHFLKHMSEYVEKKTKKNNSNTENNINISNFVNILCLYIFYEGIAYGYILCSGQLDK